MTTPPEPTDHRAKAEDWTQDAKIHFIQAALRNDDGDLIGFDPKLMRGAKVAALIGIGHALLAGPPERTVTINAPNYDGSHEELKEALVRMARQGQVDIVLRRADNQPPPSPSEG